MSPQLSRLLTPHRTDEFFTSYRKREYLYVSRNLHGYFDEVVRVEDLDSVLQSEMLPAVQLNVVRNGRLHPLNDWSRTRTLARGQQTVCIPEKILRLYGEGATLVLNLADETIPSLSRTCRELARELGFEVWANIYVTPPNAQGFTLHTDEHDVFVLQISGWKTWRIEPPGGGALIEITLREGDVLYIPRGLGHEATCSLVGSIHVTLGLQPVYAFQLIEELATVARMHPLFQDPIPALSGAFEIPESFEGDFSGRLRILLSEMTAARLIERRFGQFIDNQRTGWPGRFSDTIRIQEIKPETVLCARSAIVVRVEDEGKVINVHFAGILITVPVFLRPCLDQILSNTPFAVHDLQGMLSPNGKLEFVKPFIARGLLSIVRV